MGGVKEGILYSELQEKQLLSLFYAHKIPVDGVCISEQPNAMVAFCLSILRTLERYDIEVIKAIIIEGYTPFPINKADIPQFSSFEDCIYKVPYLIKNSQLLDINYEQMGFLLRTEPRTSVADCKYGENHAKTAHQMGLCAMSKCKINMSCLGEAFISLSFEEQKALAPKLVLYIPLIQNYFAQGKSNMLLESYLSIMSESTKQRRLPNIMTLINKVEPKSPYDI